MNLNYKKALQKSKCHIKDLDHDKSSTMLYCICIFLWCTDKKFKKAIDSIALLANAEMQIVAYYLLQLQFVKNKWKK